MNEARDKDQEQETAKIVLLQKDEFAELKRLLLSTEQSQIREILKRLNDAGIRSQEVSHILSEAIVRRAEQDKTLVSALMPTVEEIIETSVKRDPQALVDALFPVMGPAIRKSVAEFLRNMTQSLNSALERSMSVSGLKWRIEAWRTGKPFAEIVLLHSLVFRVEQVFLIHGETGLLLAHSAADLVTFQDADMVSGMLTAIQDFVRDSFRPGKGDALENLQFGELTVVVEEGPLAYLAAVIRGTPPPELRTTFKEALEEIHLTLHGALEEFDGNTAVFQAALPTLTACLQESYSGARKKAFPHLTLILVIALAGVAYWIFLGILAGARLDSYVQKLRKEKGIIVVSAERKGDRYFVRGLRDPLAADPSDLIDGSGV
ncbi:MAG: OmpA family protein, partial [Deltaproteobacteria bacterium]|nr:OmpA family protein [Deltaproteobacteria bacterium]